jgi:hypothetical protein
MNLLQLPIFTHNDLLELESEFHGDMTFMDWPSLGCSTNLDEFELQSHAVMDFSLNMDWGLFYMEESNVNEEEKAVGFSTSVKSL